MLIRLVKPIKTCCVELKVDTVGILDNTTKICTFYEDGKAPKRVLLRSDEYEALQP